MKTSRILFALIPLLILTSCTGNQDGGGVLPTPSSVSLTVSDYSNKSDFTTLVKNFKYYLNIKASDAPMKYGDINFDQDGEVFEITPIHHYQETDTYKEYNFILVSKLNAGSDSLSVFYKEISDTKTYTFTESTIESSLLATARGLSLQDVNTVFYFSSFESYVTFDNENSISKQNVYSESYFQSHDLAIANIAYSSSNISIAYGGAFIQEEMLHVAFSFEEEEEVLFDRITKAYFIQLDKLEGVNASSLFKSVRFLENTN